MVYASESLQGARTSLALCAWMEINFFLDILIMNLFRVEENKISDLIKNNVF